MSDFINNDNNESFDASGDVEVITKNKVEGDDFEDYSMYDNLWKITVVGVGGAGTNITNYFARKNNANNGPTKWPENVSIWALNTDAKSLQKNRIENLNTFLLNSKELRGNGSGGDAKIGEKAAKSDSEKISRIIDGSDIVIVVAGLGKGTGSGGGPEVLRIAKEKGIITLAVATFPSTNIEGEATLENAMKSYENYKKYATSICIVDNEKLIGGNKKNDLTLNQEFQKSNEEVYQIVNDIIEMVAIGTDNNIDLNDLKNFLKSNSLLNHLTIEIPNDNYNSNKVIKIIDEQIKNSTLKNNLSSEKINILSNAKFSRNAPRSIYDDLKTAIKEIAQHDKINMTIGHDMTDDNKNTICLFISNIEKQYDIFAPIIAAEFNDASSNTEVESEAPRTKTKRMHRGKPAKKGKGKFSENLGFDED